MVDSNRDLTAAALVLLRALTSAACLRPVQQLWKRRERGRILMLASICFITTTTSVILFAFAAKRKLPLSTSPQCLLCALPLGIKWPAYKHHANLETPPILDTSSWSQGVELRRPCQIEEAPESDRTEGSSISCCSGLEGTGVIHLNPGRLCPMSVLEFDKVDGNVGGPAELSS